jgi:hypothetical protein
MRSKTPLVLAVLVLLVAALTDLAFANPRDIPAGSRKVYQFNLIGHPGEYTGGCGNGNRLFVDRGANHAHVLVTNGSSWDVTDCNATADNRGELTTSEAGQYDVYVRILGRPGGRLHICADTFEDHESGEHLCLLGTIDLTRGSGRERFQLAPSSMFDASLEDIMWSIETNTLFRLAQFRVYTHPE